MARDTFDPLGDSYGRSVRRGTVITGASQVIAAACQVVSVIVLARILSPSDFGIVAMAWPVVALLSMFQDFGLTQATVQKPSVTAREVNFLFWANMAISTVLAGLIVLLAPLVATFYREPAVAPIVAAMGLLIFLQGAGAQHSAILTRLMRFRALAVMQVAGSVAGLAVAVGWALYEPTYWALFGGSLAAVLVPVVLAWVYSGWLPGLPRWTGAAGGLLHFGAGLTGFNVLNFVARNADNVLIGRFLGDVALGFYDRAYKLLLVPLRQVTNPLARVMLPTLSRLQTEPDRYRHAFLTVHTILVAAILPGVAAMIVVSATFIPFLLGETWAPAAAIFSALGFAGMLQPLNNPGGWLFISQGRSSEFMRWGLVTAVLALAAFVAGLPYGAFGVAVAYAISEYVKTPLLWLMVGRRGPVGWRNVLRSTGPAVLGAHLSLAVLWIVPDLWEAHPLVEAAGIAALAYIITAAVVLAFPSGREVARSALAMLPAGLLRRTSASPL